MKVITMILFVLAVGAATNFLLAQLAVFGLSLFHVDSGIWGTWLLLGVAEAVLTVGVATGKGD